MKKQIRSAGKLSLVLCLVVSWASSVRAQNDADLLRYSLLNPSGSPRFTAMGGSFGALGANFSAISTNPASLGLYSRNEISLAASVTTTYNSSEYYNEKHRDDYFRFNLPQAGSVWVLYNGKKEDLGVKRVQLGIGVNRLNDYNGSGAIAGFNNQSSYMEAVAAQNRGASLPTTDNFGSLNTPGYLAYNSFLIDADSLGNFSSFLQGGNLDQRKVWYSNGNITELALGLGLNISDKLYLGINFGVPFIHYYQKSTLTETNSNNTNLPYSFKSYDYTESVSASGTGFTFKIGAIYQILPFLRVGAWFHTPSYYTLHEDYDAAIASDMTLPSGAGGTTEGSLASSYSYGITTPSKGGLALGFIIGKSGVINIEGEILDYSKMRMKVKDDWDFEQYQNQVVKDNYKFGGTLRVGTEWRAGIGRFRAGYVFQSSPYRSHELSKAWQHHTVSAGLGLVLKGWNIDFAVAYYMQKQDDYLYNLVDGRTNQSLVQPASSVQNKLVYSLGVGFKF